MSAKKYRVYCNDESAFVTGWSESEPTTCFNNNTHVIDVNQTTLVDVQNPVNVRVLQTYTSPEDGDSYFLQSKEHYVEPNSSTDIPIKLDVDCNMFAVRINTNRETIGDNWSAYVNKDTVIGYVAETSTGTIVKMAEQSVAAVKLGYFISYDGGVTYIKVIGKTTDTVTMKESVDVTAGGIVMLTYFMVFKKTIIVPGTEVLGTSIIGSFRLPKEYNSGITYVNNSSSTKHIVVEVEMTF